MQAENHCPWLLSPFYQCTSCWSPVKSFGPKSGFSVSSVSGVCAPCSLHIWDLLSLTNVRFYYKSNPVRSCFWSYYLTHNSFDWKMVVENSCTNSSEKTRKDFAIQAHEVLWENRDWDKALEKLNWKNTSHIDEHTCLTMQTGLLPFIIQK